MIGIFPSLQLCEWVKENSDWGEVSIRIAELQGIDMSVSVTFYLSFACYIPEFTGGLARCE